MSNDLAQLAEEIRATCVRTVLDAYEDAGISGLCAEGRLEYAIDALRQLDLERILRENTTIDSGETPAQKEQKD